MQNLSISIGRKAKGVLTSLFIGFLFITIFYNAILFRPNTYLLSSVADGLKTYYNFVYHGKHDSTLLAFQGMSYPFGEYLLLEDSLPALNITNQLIANLWPSINDYSIGIINLLVLLSFIVGGIFFTLLLMRFSMPYWASAFAANGIIFLSSQVLLINPAGHFGLTFVCFFPMGWYLLIKHLDHPTSFKWTILIALNIIFWFFIHVYLGFILLLFTFLVHFFRLFLNSISVLKQKRVLIHLLLQVLLPVILIAFLFSANDHHPDRIDMPFITSHRTTFEMVFLPNHSYTKPIYNLLFDTNTQNELSWGSIGNYIGLISNAAIIIFLALLFFYTLKKQTTRIKTYFHEFFPSFLMAASMLLLFAMAVPLKFLPEGMVNSIPLIKQFSALGRFAWGFYYVISIMAVYFFYKLLYHLKWGRIAFFVIISISYFEAFALHQKVSQNVTSCRNTFNRNNVPNDQLNLLSIDTAKYQAILPIPTYFKFNLPFGGSDSDHAIYGSMISSAHTGLPIFSTYLSRPSVSESLQIFKMLNPAPYNIPIQQIQKNGKDIAVIVHHSEIESLDSWHQEILSKATLINNEGTYHIYKLSPSNILNIKYEENSDSFNIISSSLIKKGDLLVSDTNDFVFTNSFNDLPTDYVYRGKGSLKAQKKDYSLVAEFSTSQMDTSCNYVVNFWFYNHIWDQTFTTIILTETDSLNNTLQYDYYSPLKTSVIDGWWYFSEHDFKVKSTQSKLSILLKGDNKFANWIAVDELMIYPKNMDVFRIHEYRDSMDIYKNNLLYFSSKKNDSISIQIK